MHFMISRKLFKQITIPILQINYNHFLITYLKNRLRPLVRSHKESLWTKNKKKYLNKLQALRIYFIFKWKLCL